MPTMQGKVCLITGATHGIGQATALELARMGATVVIVGRNATKTSQVVEEIRSATGNKNVDSLLADLSSQQDIRQLASQFTNKYSQLDVLLNNAGATFVDRQLTVDGIERTFALNHLNYFLLTNLLLDTINASAPARIINVSSAAHTASKVDFDNLQGERSYGVFAAYATSKLENILFTNELARRLEGTGITANSLHPGLVNTGKKNNTGLWATTVAVVSNLFGKTPEKGAETSIYLASSPDVQHITGKYFVNSKVKQTASQANDLAVAKKLWDVSAEMVHLNEAVSA